MAGRTHRNQRLICSLCTRKCAHARKLCCNLILSADINTAAALPIFYFAKLYAENFSAFSCIKIKLFRFCTEGTTRKITYLHSYNHLLLSPNMPPYTGSVFPRSLFHGNISHHLLGMEYLIKFFFRQKAKFNACLFERNIIFICLFGGLCRIFISDIRIQCSYEHK